MNVPYPKLLATPTTAATTQAVGSFASIRAGSPGVRKNPFLTLNVNVLLSSLKNRMPFSCGDRSVSKRGEVRTRVVGPTPRQLEVAGRHHVALAAGPDDLRALVRPPIANVRILRLVVEHHEVAHPEHARRGRIHRASHRNRIGVLVDGGVEAGPQIDRQLVHVIEHHGDLVRGDDVHVPGVVRLPPPSRPATNVP